LESRYLATRSAPVDATAAPNNHRTAGPASQIRAMHNRVGGTGTAQPRPPASCPPSPGPDTISTINSHPRHVIVKPAAGLEERQRRSGPVVSELAPANQNRPFCAARTQRTLHRQPAHSRRSGCPHFRAVDTLSNALLADPAARVPAALRRAPPGDAASSWPAGTGDPAREQIAEQSAPRGSVSTRSPWRLHACCTLHGSARSDGRGVLASCRSVPGAGHLPGVGP
jgi:hypothetical protein